MIQGKLQGFVCNFSMWGTQGKHFWLDTELLPSYQWAVYRWQVAHCTTSARVQLRLCVDAMPSWRPGFLLHAKPPIYSLSSVTWALAWHASWLIPLVWWLPPVLSFKSGHPCLFHHRSLTGTVHPIVDMVFPLMSKNWSVGCVQALGLWFIPKIVDAWTF